ncbi:putative DNA polymerase alpha catalytic subunit [Blattamonas nauphoetae]|uniref:DNA polymerase n=1 Tax=Blattamonas nauphoetae TaxID=2049346 RepID=A0ABQ9YFI3_9EUKA|nr:putative DNA polymerase alpha catalytic subunit [Blattamonas nauphoetae]
MLDWLYVIVFSILTTILVEVINYFAVFSRDSFKTKKANLDRAKDRMESLRRANFEHSSGHKAGYQEKKIKLEQAEVDRFSAELQMDKLKTTAIQTVIQFIFTGMFHSYFEGRIMAKLPFNPPGFLRRITHRDQLENDLEEESYSRTLSAEDRYFLKLEYEEERKEHPIRIQGQFGEENEEGTYSIHSIRRRKQTKDITPTAVPGFFLKPQSGQTKTTPNLDMDSVLNDLTSQLMSDINGEDEDDMAQALQQGYSHLLQGSGSTKAKQDQTPQAEEVVSPTNALLARLRQNAVQTQLRLAPAPQKVENSQVETYQDDSGFGSNEPEPPEPQEDTPEDEMLKDSDPTEETTEQTEQPAEKTQPSYTRGGSEFYLVDIQEPRGTGALFLFGKMHNALENRLETTSVRVEGLVRTLHFLPKRQLTQVGQSESVAVTPAMVEVELRTAFKQNSTSLAKQWERIEKNIIFSTVEKQFPFDGVDEAPPVATYLRVAIPAELDHLALLPKNAKTYSHVFGLTQTLTESFMLERQIHGSSWLRLRSTMRLLKQNNDTLNTTSPMQFKVFDPATIENIPADQAPPPPPLTVLTLSVQTAYNSKSRQHDIICIAGHTSKEISPGVQTTRSDVPQGDDFPKGLDPSFVITAPIATGVPLPQGTKQEFENFQSDFFKNQLTQNAPVRTSSGAYKRTNETKSIKYTEAINELSLLLLFTQILKQLDPDIIVGHSLITNILGLIARKLDGYRQKSKTGSTNQNETFVIQALASLGRLKRNHIQYLSASGMDYHVQMLTGGRLLLDTYLSAKEFIRAGSYTMEDLVVELFRSKQLRYVPLDPGTINPAMFTLPVYMGMVKNTMREARIAFNFMLEMNVVSLTNQLSQITKSLWRRVLVGGRAERVENLLMYNFRRHKNGVILLPDKQSRDPKIRALMNGTSTLLSNPSHNTQSQHAPEEEFPDDNVEDMADEADDDDAELENMMTKVTIDSDPQSTKLSYHGNKRGKTQTKLSTQPTNQQQQGTMGVRGKRKKAAYTGGYVMEAQRGYYDNYILILDFNSLYPSIIQEYNICHTTIDRGQITEEDLPSMVTKPAPGVLPGVVRELIEKRRAIQRTIGDLANKPGQQVQAQLASLNTTQLAYKLVANSLYGCLGFTAGRFYAQRLAMMITWRGRNALKSAHEKVSMSPTRCEVIYGDTDSLMISTEAVDLKEVLELGEKLSEDINRGKKNLKIDIDGIFARLLLLRKKKYAGMKLVTPIRRVKELDALARQQQRPITGIEYKMEVKGMELKRRDWSGIVKKAQSDLLAIILAAPSAQRVDTGVDNLDDEMAMEREYEESPIAKIDKYLRELSHQLRNGDIPIEQFVIRKGLMKPIEQYADKNSQPHVMAAEEARQVLKLAPRPGDYIPYIICKGEGTPAQRAHHEAVVRSSQKQTASQAADTKQTPLVPDIDWYLVQQVHPTIQRLTESVEGMTPHRIAEDLGMDTAKYRDYRSGHGTGGGVSTDILNMGMKFKSCAPLKTLCRHCQSTVTFPPPPPDLNDVAQTHTPEAEFTLACQSCGELFSARQLEYAVRLTIRRLTAIHYNSTVIFDDPGCDYETDMVNIWDNSCPMKPCRGHQVLKHTGEEYYTQLIYFTEIFTPISLRNPTYGSLVPHVNLSTSLEETQRFLDPIHRTLKANLDRCNYGRINLFQLFSNI